MKVLDVFEQGKEQSVHEVQKALKKRGDDFAYNTVLTLLVRMTEKGTFSRRKEGRSFY